MWWNDYLSVPFLEKGRDQNGCDCWGLVRLVYKSEWNIDLPDYLDCYDNTEDRQALGVLIDDEKKQWINSNGDSGDVIIVNMRGVPMHVGIVTRRGFMLHCAKGINTVHERYDSFKWRSKVVGFAKHKRLLQPASL